MKKVIKVTSFRRKAEKGETALSTLDIQAFMERIKRDTRESYIMKYREAYDLLGDKTAWENYWRIPEVCLTSEYRKKANGQREWMAYNGLSVVIVDELNGQHEVEIIKRQAALFPQVFAAFMGGNGHSAVIITVSSLPGGTLPRDEQKAKLFCAQAYATSVRCLTPSLSHQIHILPPLLDQKIMMPLDENPYINPHPAPFIIEQPTDGMVKHLLMNNDSENRLERLPATPETFVTFNELFNVAFHRAARKVPAWQVSEARDEAIIPVLAEMCCRGGLPEEEAYMRIQEYFYNVSSTEVRGMVELAYEKSRVTGAPSRIMGRRQLVAFQLPKFLAKRYEIRYNEVMNMTEFRRRTALDFMYRELTPRNINTIHHEACLAGINASDSDVERLIHSDMIMKYNPIDDYFRALPRWDGKDRITEVARMVPTDNPHWERLFFRWFLSMVSHWVADDNMHANSTAPILIGAQGYRKSTFCRQLLPPELTEYFTDSIDFRTDIEAERMLGRFLMINIDEFDQLSEKQFAFVKHLFQKPVTNMRRMYSETIGRQRRYASFIGTSNHHEVLRDPTGNRRYICVEVKEPIHTEQSIEYGQLYAQALYLINHGERTWLNDEDEALIRQTNESFSVVQPIEMVLLSMFEVPEAENDGGEWISPTEVLECLATSRSLDKRDASLKKLGDTATRLNIKVRRNRSGKLYYLRRKNNLNR